MASAAIIVFLVGYVIGDPISQLLPPEASAEARAELEAELGFDQPISVQFVNFVQRSFSGFGESIYTGEPALETALSRLPATLFLASIAALIAFPVGLAIGAWSGRFPNSFGDRLVNIFGLGGVSVVDFWLGLMLILVFAVELGWFPTGGYGSGKYVVLPALTLSYRTIGRLSQVTRAAIREEYKQPYVELLRTKGVSEKRVFGHVVKNAAIPVVTLGGDELITLANGALVVETVFAWPGIGRLLIQAISLRDLFLVEATIFVIAGVVVLGNLMVDLIYQFLDPRISLTTRKAA